MIFRHLLNMRSHPTWVRGLKLTTSILTITLQWVAPYVGAWIETTVGGGGGRRWWCRTLRGCVD